MNKNKRLWLLLALPPIFFLLVIIAFSIFYSISGVTDSDEIVSRITGNIPLLLLVVQIFIFALLVVILRKEEQKVFDFGWINGKDSGIVREISLGLMIGIGLGVVYIFWLSPLHVYLQSTFGDYVPAGQVLSGLGGSAVIFFLANVLLAPFVEERLYRGYALTQLKQRFGTGKAIVISSVFFGLLHWMGGFWYMVITGGVVGLLFGVLAVKRGNIVLVFVAHLSLNIVEFLYVTQVFS